VNQCNAYVDWGGLFVALVLLIAALFMIDAGGEAPEAPNDSTKREGK